MLVEKYKGFKAELAIAETLEDFNKIELKAKIVAEIAVKEKIGKTEQDEWGEFRTQIKSKKGDWLEYKFPKSVRSKDRKLSGASMAPDKSMPVSKHESSNARLIFNESELVKESIEEIKNSTDVVTPNKVASRVRKKKKEKEKETQAKEGSKIKISNDKIDIRFGNFVEVLENIPDNTIDLILTDPPYPHEFIECWSELSLFAGRKLKINGFCIAYSGQTNLIEVMNRMSENLFYYWTFALIHSGNKQLINHRNIFCGWKPLLVFQNGKKKQDNTCEDIISGTGMEKSFHKWQQAEAELIPIIEHFTKPGDIICDPFLGGGTTAIISYELKRRFIGAEIEEEQFNIAKKRINEYIRVTT